MSMYLYTHNTILSSEITDSKVKKTKKETIHNKSIKIPAWNWKKRESIQKKEKTDQTGSNSGIKISDKEEKYLKKIPNTCCIQWVSKNK